MIHEEAARKVHPGAVNFDPVRGVFSNVIGWVFEIPQTRESGERQASYDIGWVTADGEASLDRLDSFAQARKNLRAYLSVRRTQKRATPREFM